VDFLAVNYFTSHFVKAAPLGAPKDQVHDGPAAPWCGLPSS
jgi:hypothetical protein